MLQNIKKIIKDKYWDNLYQLQYGREIIKAFASDYVQLHNNRKINILDKNFLETNFYRGR